MSRQKIKVGDCIEFGNKLYALDLCDGEPPLDEIPEWHGFRGESRVWFDGDVAKIVPTLHLPIGNNTKKYGGAWFDMIRQGIKKEEYREFFGMDKGSPINIKMLVEHDKSQIDWLVKSFKEQSPFYQSVLFKPWKVLHLTNGYGHNKPQLWAHIESILIGRGNPEWGAPVDRDVFIIRIGEVFHTKNIK